MHVALRMDDTLRRAALLYPDVESVIEGERRWTYREFQEEVHQLAHAMTRLGVEKGDRVAVLSPNTTAMLQLFYACFQLGAVVVPLNTRLLPHDYLYIIEHAEAKLFFADDELIHLVESIVQSLTTVSRFVSMPVNGVASEREGWDSYSNLLANESTEPCITEIEETDLATILYTSGTTGKPKGVMHSHRTLYFNMQNTMFHLRATDSDVLLHTLPIFHVNGWGTPFSFTAVGAKHVMLRKIDPLLIHSLIKNEGVTVACMAPTVLNLLINEPRFHEEKTTAPVRIVIAGSAPPTAFVRAVEQQLGWEFLQVYGMTECAPLITVSPIKHHLMNETEETRFRMKAKAGIPMHNVEIRVVDDEENEVPKDGKSIGEVVARGNMVMEGYWKQPEATAAAIVNGWYHTGDMATIDVEGYIDIVDRKKDIIISGGENISSIEVEGLLYEHPGILEAAVISVPHEKWGEVPHAIVVPRPGTALDQVELENFCRGKMAAFKCPKGFTIVRELPKTASGKIRKVELRQPFWEEKGKLVN
ncbi:AMP-dependent synthetase [Brevibacillus choshinensis]|uniref:AMP-dependent synthetase n=1 Tax=Brevibacillus choshinensis TaxID=54911 RepID=A0ABR5N110_BRECH|nr:long-chain-fatty-acid--CoA ligase [Brevibacillus choshinensis]KQL44170.1 AMP-dependent synthetase [Brevibacillus choshinensis]